MRLATAIRAAIRDGRRLRLLPRRGWVDAIRAAAETAPFDRLDYPGPGGLPELRTVLAELAAGSAGREARRVKAG